MSVCHFCGDVYREYEPTVNERTGMMTQVGLPAWLSAILYLTNLVITYI